MSKKIKILDHLELIVDGEIYILHSYPELWEKLGWDIENDKEASECATMIVKEVFCFGEIDLSCLTNNEHLVYVKVVK